MPDADGYPTDAELERLRSWPANDPQGWLEFARSCWWEADWGWPELRTPEVSTGGWSGNETIIAVMQEHALWRQVFVSVRRGGHYTFRVPEVNI